MTVALSEPQYCHRSFSTVNPVLFTGAYTPQIPLPPRHLQATDFIVGTIHTDFYRLGIKFIFVVLVNFGLGINVNVAATS